MVGCNDLQSETALALAPGAVIGILGDGQLGRLLAHAAQRLGFHLIIFGPNAHAPAQDVVSQHIKAAYDDEKALSRLAKACDVISFEFENIPTQTLITLKAMGARLAPSDKALSLTQDRLIEKQFVRDLGISTVDFKSVESKEDLDQALLALGGEAILKTRREGYDGKGQVRISQGADTQLLWAQMSGQALILEGLARFDREVSVVCARATDGTMAFYPLGENRHAGGILQTTLAPCQATESMISEAYGIARCIGEGLDYVGVFAVELFVMSNGALWVNEIAPRVHNSGHWTQEGCLCDQFEQHIRAIAGWPLGPTQALHQIEMRNLLGTEYLEALQLAKAHDVKLHLYGKTFDPVTGPKSGRKMGHVNKIIDAKTT